MIYYCAVVGINTLNQEIFRIGIFIALSRFFPLPCTTGKKFNAFQYSPERSFVLKCPAFAN